MVVDDAVLASPTTTLTVLLDAWHAGRRLVVEVQAALHPDLPPEPVCHEAPWSLPATFLFAEELLHHLVWANSVDLRGPVPVWRWWEEAVAVGASFADPSAPPSAPHATGLTHDRATSLPPGEVVLPDGRWAWCHGGPLTAPPDGLTVVHRISLERGALEPLGTGACGAALALDQLEAVEHPGAAARIIAPAGSGKTRVLTERARHLLGTWRVPPTALTLVAFNTRAADELRERTPDLRGLQIRTLNALALAIIDGRPPFAARGRRHEVLDERAVRRLLDQLVDHPKRTNTDPMAPWLDALSLVRLGLRSPIEVEAAFDGEVDGLPDVVDRYRRLLGDQHAVDFDDQITRAIEVLLTDPGARAAARRACRVLLVDEFQDLAPAHLLLVRLLAAPDLAVVGVGDDDQTIYGYAGATPEWLIGYRELFPGAGDHPLTVNYRCPPAVVEAASHLLARNTRRVPKVVQAAPGRERTAEAFRVAVVDEPVEATVTHVRQLIDAGAEPSSVAVLARVNASLAPVQLSCLHHGVPVRAAVGPSWLERTGVRAALAWVRLATAPKEWRPADLREAARRPSRGLSGKVVDWVAEQRSAAGLRALANRLSRGRDQQRIEELVHDLEWLATVAARGTTARVLQAVRTDLRLDEAMATLDGFQRAAKQSAQADDLDALEAVAHLHPTPATFAPWLHQQLSQPGTPDGVLLATVHGVKGREYPHVIVHDVSASLFPHALSDDVEEERRVLHVAVTRARDDTLVVAPAARPSPFLTELQTAPGAAERERVVGRAGRASRRPEVATPAPRSTQTGTAGRAARAVAPSAPPAEGPVADALRAWRRARARTEGIPAYVVFPDATLDAVVAAMPTDAAALARLPGFGPTRLERYGDDVLSVLDGLRSAAPAAEPHASPAAP